MCSIGPKALRELRTREASISTVASGNPDQISEIEIVSHNMYSGDGGALDKKAPLCARATADCVARWKANRDLLGRGSCRVACRRAHPVRSQDIRREGCR